MTDPALPSAAYPDWLPGAAAAAIAASLMTVTVLAGRYRRGRPLIARRPHSPVPWEGSDVLVVVTLAIVAAAIAGVPLGKDPPVERQLAGGLVVQGLAAVLAIGWLMTRGATATDLGFVPGRPVADLRLAVVALAAVLAPLLALATILNTLVPYRHAVMDMLAARRDPWAIGLVLAAALVAAPLAEELFFRRILQGWLEKRLPQADGAVAIAISAAAFALAHQGQGLAYVPLFPLGIVLGFMARRTGSLVPCILLHALFNSVSLGILLASPAPTGVPVPSP